MCIRDSINAEYMGIYGYTDPVYNFIYLDDIIVTLNNFVTEASTSADRELVLMIAETMDQNCFDKIQITLDTIFTDIQNRRLDYIQVKKDNIDFLKILREYLHSSLNFFTSLIPMDYPTARTMATVLHNMLTSFDTNLGKLNQFLIELEKPRDVNMEIRCYSAENYPNGDNRVLEAQVTITLMELIMMVEARYQKTPLSLKYIDDLNEKIMLDNDSVLARAVERAFANAKASGTNIILRLLVSSPTIFGVPIGQNSNLNRIFFQGNKVDLFKGSATNLRHKDFLLEDLRARTQLSAIEIEQIYHKFIAVTSQRLANQEAGLVNLDEFIMIMKDYVNDLQTIRDMFNAMDVNSTGKIDFRDFVLAMNILKAGSLEERLKLAFLAYDTDHNGYIDKIEFYKLIGASLRAKGIQMTEFDAMAYANAAFAKADKNRDGRLIFEEFREAVLSDQILLNPFWTNSKLMLFVY
eukprot:TRINITY_DN8772_c0_g1_i3.p1 TRINITY_DN8772_c0_g1~~TRINITY_DN8772_c0_g1_i3.p1  ORF type:complete len:466 (+),score=119.13 TRINITY_DN8772_c0_g1_i3:72-1469(+)